MIGQFGVGFYSSFIIGNTVEVLSKKESEPKAHCWTSDGSGTFEISEVEDFNLERGTRIIIHLNPEYIRFANKDEIKKIIDKYSNFINHKIYLNHEKINLVQALWSKSATEVEEKEYQQFYEFLTGTKNRY